MGSRTLCFPKIGRNYKKKLNIKHLKPDQKNKKNLAMLRKIHGTNFFHRKFLGHISIKCQNGPVLPLPQVFYFNGQALLRKRCYSRKLSKND
jgi:hypothetical protein